MKRLALIVVLVVVSSVLSGCFQQDKDGDGVEDDFDNCPDVINPDQADNDLLAGIDGGNECDEDDDNDGILDIDDECPIGDMGWNSTDFSDIDSDGCRDTTEDFDDDSDGTLDTEDNCPAHSNPNQADHDEDGIGDACDDDDDGDSVLDSDDRCPLGHTGWTFPTHDYDLDGCSDIEDSDDDNDGVPDLYDDFPLDETESIDTDSDGIGNNEDWDDDDDLSWDDIDAFPLDPSEQFDTDEDGIGDNEDEDDDNDGCLDSEDALPLNPDSCLDWDGDGIADEIDLDDDNDGVPDSDDACQLSYDILVIDIDGVWSLMYHYGIGPTEIEESIDTNEDGLIDDYDGDGCLVWEDTDDDGDGLHEGPPGGSGEWWLYSENDNCVIVSNVLQEDLDEDGEGDACDTDIDGDGVDNQEDWEDYGNGVIAFFFYNFSIWNGGIYDSGGGLPDVYPYLGVGTWDGSNCNDVEYNENYISYIQEDASTLSNWLLLTWDVPEDISAACFDLIMYDEDSWAPDEILDFVPGSTNAIFEYFYLSPSYNEMFEYDNRGENSKSILLEFNVYATTS